MFRATICAWLSQFISLARNFAPLSMIAAILCTVCALPAMVGMWMP